VDLIFTGLHNITSQKTELFIATAVRTSNPALLGIHNKMAKNNLKEGE
jgi:hypothetical protein